MTTNPRRKTETSPAVPLKLTLFGPFALHHSDGSEIAITIKRARALLAVLCLNPGTPMDREKLCALLWSGRFRAQARASLRQTLLGLKKQLSPFCGNLFEVSRETVAINPAAIRSDLSELESALERGTGASEILLTIGSTPLLENLEFGDPFADWLRARREEVEQRLRQALEQALAECLRCGDDKEHARLTDAWKVRNHGRLGSTSDSRIRIAILPFEAADSGDGTAPLALGLFDELITTLAQMPQLRVAGRGSSMVVGRSGRPLPEQARALRVAHLVQGSVQRQGDQVRVHVSLVDGRTGFASWAHRYRGTTDDVFGLQEDVARAVARELGVALELSFQAPRQRRTTQKKAAYELYLQGRALTARAIGDGVLAKAVELLEAALDIDPRFSACWTALAEAHVYTAVYTPCLDRLGQSARMAQCAEKAIELDPAQGHARAMLGIHKWICNDPTGALDLAFEAFRLEPDNPDVAVRLGSFLLYIGHTREALPYIERAIDQDPVNGRNYAMLSVAHLNLGNVGAAIAAGQRMVDLGMPSMWLAAATAAAGDHERAVEQYRQTRLLMNTVIFAPAGTEPLTGKELDDYWRVAATGVCSGQPEARAFYCSLLDRLHATLPDPGDTSIVLPAIWMGYAEMVFKTLGQQISPANVFCLMSLWADIEPIRQIRIHRDFMPFAERIGLTAAWEKYGWPDLLSAPVDS